MNDNQELKKLLMNMPAGAPQPSYQPGATISDRSVYVNTDYLKPYPKMEQDGSSRQGVTRKFENSHLSIVSHTTGEPGVYPRDVNAGELAYYQI